MSEAARTPDLPEEPDISHLVTEDDEPVESFFQNKQMDILTEALRVSWPEGRPFVSGADVGIFYAVKEAIVPDVLLSVGVEPPADLFEKKGRSYFIWVFGKPPDVVFEIVSNREGGELTRKLRQYCEIRIPYYVVHDPHHLLGNRTLRIFQLSGASYVEKVDRLFPELGLGLTLWTGCYDDMEAEWLRWTRSDGELLSTGLERAVEAEAEHRRAEAERQRAEAEHERAETANQRAETANQRAETERHRREVLEARLRELGVDPETV